MKLINETLIITIFIIYSTYQLSITKNSIKNKLKGSLTNKNNNFNKSVSNLQSNNNQDIRGQVSKNSITNTSKYITPNPINKINNEEETNTAKSILKSNNDIYNNNNENNYEKIIDNKNSISYNTNNNSKTLGIEKLNDSPPKQFIYEPVQIVKELSPSGKAALELKKSGDLEYLKILNEGYETPKTISSIFKDKITKVERTSNSIENLKNLANNQKWENVEFHRQYSPIVEVGNYQTPVKYENNKFGDVIVNTALNNNNVYKNSALGSLININNVRNNVSLIQTDEDEDFIENFNLDNN